MLTREHINKVRRERYARNPEKILAKCREYYWTNKEICLKKSKIWREKNKENQRLYKIRRKFNITDEQYLTLLKSHNNKCAICGKEQDYQNLGVDHNHKTGEIRGMLCARCNIGIGQFQDNISLLKKAIQYLKKFERKDVEATLAFLTKGMK